MDVRRPPVEVTRWPTRGARAWLAPRSSGQRLHAGVDLGRALEPVVAPERGVVELVGRASYAGEEPRESDPHGWAGYGPELVLFRGDSGWHHLLAHLSGVHVQPGDVLEAGEEVGSVARVGAHVHWEVRRVPRPLGGAATVEVVDDPRAWLEYQSRPWTHDMGCPPSPGRTHLTPRACRPGASSTPAGPMAPDARPAEDRPPSGPTSLRPVWEDRPQVGPTMRRRDVAGAAVEAA